MAFVRKGAPPAKSLNDPEGVAQASQRSAGNAGYDITRECYSSGVSPVDSQGRVTNKTGTVMGWPYVNFTEKHLLEPSPNKAVEPQVSDHPSTSGRPYNSAGRVSSGAGTLGLVG